MMENGEAEKKLETRPGGPCKPSINKTIPHPSIIPLSIKLAVAGDSVATNTKSRPFKARK